MLLRTTVSGVLLGLVAMRLDLSAALAALRSLQPALFGWSLALYVAGQVVAALRWMILARAVGFVIPATEAVRMNLIALFFGLVVPTTAGTDATRAYYLGRAPPGPARAISCVIFDRLIAFSTLALVGAIAAAGAGPNFPPLVRRTASVAGLACLLAWLFAPLVAGRVPPTSRIRRFFREDLGGYFRDPVLLGRASLLSVAVVALQVCAQKLLAEAVGIDPSLVFVAFYHAVVVVAGSLPISIAGFGTREAAYAYVMSLTHVDVERATALRLLWFAVGVLSSLCGGVVFVLVGPPAVPPPAETR
jgi:uncharacterized membrane protein YbhN (UPF0104 family)